MKRVARRYRYTSGQQQFKKQEFGISNFPGARSWDGVEETMSQFALMLGLRGGFLSVWVQGGLTRSGEQSPTFEADMYRCEVPTVGGFVQQVAVSYLAHGYFFYVAGIIPEGKDPRRVDEKLVERYRLDISKWTRARRKRAGLANVAYLRHCRFFVLLATHGEHPFFDAEGAAVRDVRRVPIKFGSYSIGFRGGHPHVRIAEPTMRDLKEQLRGLALRRSSADLGAILHRLPFEPYAPVRSQFCELLRLVNRLRSVAGLERVSNGCLRFRRMPLRVFGDAVGPLAAASDSGSQTL